MVIIVYTYRCLSIHNFSLFLIANRMPQNSRCFEDLNSNTWDKCDLCLVQSIITYKQKPLMGTSQTKTGDISFWMGAICPDHVVNISMKNKILSGNSFELSCI